MVEHSFVPDHIKALRVAYNWFNTNEVYFREGDSLNHEQYGWIRPDSDDKETICFNEDSLKKQIVAALGPNRYGTSVDCWKNEKILNPRTIEEKDKKGNVIKTKVLKTQQITVNCRRQTVIQIPLLNFYKYLELDEEETAPVIPKHEEETGGNDNSKYAPYINVSGGTVPHTTTNVSPASSSEFNPVNSATASINDNIIVPDSSTNLHDLLMNSMTGDDK